MSGLVDDLFNGVLGLADGLLGLAFELLRGALNLKVRVAHGFADALLNRAGDLVNCALDLIVVLPMTSLPKNLSYRGLPPFVLV